MRLEEILDINRRPFDRDIINDDVDDYEYSENVMDIYIRFILYTMYYNKFLLQMNINIKLHTDAVYLCCEALKLQEDRIKLSMKRESLNRNLFQEIMNWAEWGVCSMQVGDTMVEESDIKDVLGEMMEELPELRRDAEGTFLKSNVYCCWSIPLAKYLWYEKQNVDLVKSKFKNGDAVLREILSDILDPLQIDTGLTYFCLMKDRFAIGFYEGTDDTYTASFEHLHPHFCVNIVTLKYLLDYAQSLFLI